MLRSCSGTSRRLGQRRDVHAAAGGLTSVTQVMTVQHKRRAACDGVCVDYAPSCTCHKMGSSMKSTRLQNGFVSNKHIMKMVAVQPVRRSVKCRAATMVAGDELELLQFLLQQQNRVMSHEACAALYLFCANVTRGRLSPFPFLCFFSNRIQFRYN